MNSDVLRQELEAIRLANGGILHEEFVVERASDKTSVLHECFTWDDTEAARKYRLEEARGLIRRVFVTFEAADGSEVPVRMYTSLASDRLSGGGYRAVGEVMGDGERRSELLATALSELTAMQVRYQQLVELAPVFEAMEQVRLDKAREAARAPKKRKRKSTGATATP